MIKDISSAHVVKQAEDYSGKDNVIIENLTDCTVVIPFTVKCVYMKKVARCKIYVGVCCGACFVDSAEDSTICIQSH